MKKIKKKSLLIYFSNNEVGIYEALRKYAYDNPATSMTGFIKEVINKELKRLNYL